MKVLIVEKEKIIANAMADFLESRGHVCTITSDGEIGLEIFKTNKFDAVITDIGIPILNGIELVIEVKKLNPYVKIVCLSAYIGLTKIDLDEIGIQNVLHKPINLGELVETLEHYK